MLVSPAWLEQRRGEMRCECGGKESGDEGGCWQMNDI
jgi:hypothetical protein